MQHFINNDDFVPYIASVKHKFIMIRYLFIVATLIMPFVAFTQSNVEDQAVRRCEVMPAFGDCVDAPTEDLYRCSSAALMEYVGARISYPELAMEMEVQGTIYIVFIIEKDGSVDDVRIMRGVGDNKGALALETEAIRIVKDLPDFRPGTEGGEEVRVQFVVPVKFVLE
jgi:TonB family protein